MTSIQGSQVCLQYLMTQNKEGVKPDSISWDDIYNKMLIPASTNKNEFIAAILSGLQILVNAGLMDLIQLDPNDIKSKIFVLKSPLETQNRNVEIPMPLCVTISQIVNNFSNATGDESLACDPNNITSQHLFILCDIIGYLSNSEENDEDLDDDSDTETIEDLEEITKKEKKNNKNKDK